ncbi:MAG TPA: sugar phosphate isomerase/epimerase [Pirellulales bacterium]|nr:sugar phosphate isomerase/epimerase [Pirellulales bacterium]
MKARKQSPIERRVFLKQGVAVAVILAGNRALTGESEAATIPFAYSLYGMKMLPLERALAACAEMGYDAVELATMEGWHADPAKLSGESRQKLSRLLSDLNLGLASLMENVALDVDDAVHRRNVDRLRSVAEIAHELAPDRPPLIETVLGGKAGTWESVRERFAARLTDWERVAADTQTVLAVKPHRFGAMNTPEQALWLLERVQSPWIRLVYDFSHFQHREFAMTDTLRQLLPSAAMIHIKDAVVEDGKPRFVLPGDGGVDYVELLKQAVAGGFSGPVCVEVSGMVQSQRGYDAIAAAERAYQNVAPAFSKAGVSRSRK